MKGDWIILINDGCPTSVPIAPCDDISLADAETGTFLLIDAADVGAKQDSLTSIRMVGEIHNLFRALYSGTLLSFGANRMDRFVLFEGIYKSTVDDAGLITVLDPRSSIDMESDLWMWRKTTLFTTGTIAAAAGSHVNLQSFDNGQELPSGAHIDIRVKRKLSASEVIAYTSIVSQSPILGSTDISANFSMVFYPQLRGYVKF